MENRKRQLKSSRRIMTRRNAYNHGRSSASFKPQPLETTIIPNYPVNNNNNNKQRTNATSSSTSMRAFNFNIDSLGRNQNFIAFPKDPIDRRIVKVQNKTPLYRNPASYNLIMQSTYLLGGVNGNLGLEKSVVNEITSNYFKFLKKISGKSAPSDRDIIFGNARMLLKQATTGWENSRIQWLLDLEHRQDMRRARAQLCENDCVDLCCFPFSPHMLMWNTE